MKNLVTPGSRAAPKLWRFGAKLPILAISATLMAIAIGSARPSEAQTDCATIASSTERLSCYDRAAAAKLAPDEPTQPAQEVLPQNDATATAEGVQPADSPEAGSWGPEIVVAGDVGFNPCGAQRNDPTCLRGLGFSDQAVAFALALDGDYGGMSRAVEFHELGAVDLGIAEVTGASVWGVPVLLNGSPDLIPITPTLNLPEAFKDETSQEMLARFPEASPRDSELRAHRTLPDGTQRFVLLESVTDQCRACDLIGSATTYLEIGPSTGGTLVRRPIGLLLGGADRDGTLTPAVIRSQPDSLQMALNVLGYDAGPMDGYPGPQSRAALMEFQAEHCLPVTGQPDQMTADALISAKGFSRPCEGAQIPAGISANSPLLPGIYVDDLAKCQLESLPYEDIHLTQRIVQPEGIITFGQEGACTVQRSDLRDGVTLFRGQCAEGNTTADARWTFDVTSNETYVELNSVFDVPPRSFAKCPDDSTLRQAWSAWFAETTEEPLAGSDTAGATDNALVVEPIGKTADLFNVFDQLLFTPCGVGCEFSAVEGTYEARLLELNSVPAPEIFSSCEMFYEQAINRCNPPGVFYGRLRPHNLADAVVYLVERTGCQGDECAKAVVAIDRIALATAAKDPAYSGEGGLFIDLKPQSELGNSAPPLAGLRFGRYAKDVSLCAGVDQDGDAFRVLSEDAVSFGQDAQCQPTGYTGSGTAFEFTAHCPFSEEGFVATWRWRPLNEMAFIEERGLFGDASGQRFDLCPDGTALDPVAVPGEAVPAEPGLTEGAAAIARELLAAYGADRNRMELVADNADFAVLAWAAYEAPEALEAARERRWMVMETIVNPNLLAGNTAAVRFAAEDGRQVLAFRGTKTGGDWITNTAGTLVPSALTTAQIAGAVEIALAMKGQFPEIVFVGHSLGGRLAQVARLRTGNIAVAFNSAPLGIEDTSDAIARRLIERLLGQPEITSEVRLFRNPNDALTALSVRNQIEVSNSLTAEGVEGFSRLNLLKLAIYFVVEQKEVYHSMAMLAGAMQQVRVARDEGWLEDRGETAEEPSQQAAAPIPRWPFPKNGLRGAEIDLATAMALGVHFGSPAEVFEDGAFPAGLKDATEFEKRRAVSDMVEGLKQRSKDFSGKDDLYLVFEAQGDARERSSIRPYDFEHGNFRFCLPTTFSLPLNGFGIKGGFPASILVGFPVALGDQANCSYGEIPGQSSHRSHAYYTIEMKDVAEAEAFDKLTRQSLHLRVFCYLSAQTIEGGKKGTYKRETKAFGPGWPLVCTAARIEASQTQDSALLFALDFTSGKAVFEAQPSDSAP